METITKTFDITNLEKAQNEYLENCNDCNRIVNSDIYLRQLAEAFMILREKIGDLSCYEIDRLFGVSFGGVYTLIRKQYWINLPTNLEVVINTVKHEIMDDGFLGIFRAEYNMTVKRGDSENTVPVVQYFMTDTCDKPQDDQIEEYTSKLNSRSEARKYELVSYQLYEFTTVEQLTELVLKLCNEACYEDNDMNNGYFRTDGFLDEFIDSLETFDEEDDK